LLFSITNANLNVSGDQVPAGTAINVTCRSGYNLTVGNMFATVYCKPDGFFSMQRNGSSITTAVCSRISTSMWYFDIM